MSHLPPDPPSEGVGPMAAPERKASPASVLTGPRPPVTRWNRKYLLAGSAALASVVAFGFYLGFGGSHTRAAKDQDPHAAADQAVVASSIAIDRLNFAYRIQPIGARRGPRWQPLRVFDDGLKTYIQFPADLAATEAPPLFLIGPNKQAELVNYRFANGYYVVDRMIDVAELRLGEGRQVVVRISRTGGAR